MLCANSAAITLQKAHRGEKDGKAFGTGLVCRFPSSAGDSSELLQIAERSGAGEQDMLGISMTSK